METVDFYDPNHDDKSNLNYQTENFMTKISQDN
jgi:hypothetical protein